jgi:hypothetical protein
MLGEQLFFVSDYNGAQVEDTERTLRARIAELEALVVGLATEYPAEDGDDACNWCRSGPWCDPARHGPDCAWRKAKEYLARFSPAAPSNQT